MSREAAQPLPPEAFEQLLRSRAPRFGVSTPEVEKRVPALAAYLSELDRWRRRVDLTGNLTASDLADHAFESLLPIALIVHGERVVDIGSGAGFPGLPIAIARTDIEMSLVEPRAKRASFLRHVVRSLNLNGVSVVESRIEEVGGQTFGCATTRAVGNFATWLGEARFLRHDGVLMAWTTDPAGVGAQLPGFRAERVLPLPDSSRRVVAVYQRVS